MGFKNIVLLGVDHRFGFDRKDAKLGGNILKVEGRDSIHFDASYNPPGHVAHCDMIATERSFALAYSFAKKNGVNIVNATPMTGLNEIPCVDPSPFYGSV